MTSSNYSQSDVIQWVNNNQPDVIQWVSYLVTLNLTLSYGPSNPSLYNQVNYKVPLYNQVNYKVPLYNQVNYKVPLYNQVNPKISRATKWFILSFAVQPSEL